MSATQLLDPIKQTVEVDQSGGFRFDNCTRLGQRGILFHFFCKFLFSPIIALFYPHRKPSFASTREGGEFKGTFRTASKCLDTRSTYRVTQFFPPFCFAHYIFIFPSILLNFFLFDLQDDKNFLGTKLLGLVQSALTLEVHTSCVFVVSCFVVLEFHRQRISRSLYFRNVALGKMGMNPPRVRSTGTTIVAVTYKVRL